MWMGKMLGLALLLAPGLVGDGGSMKQAKGDFEVKLVPGAAEAGMPGIGRMEMEKQYHGDLEAKATGLMLSAGNPKSGNAGYVAIERVTGTLVGRVGSFALMQEAQMATGTAPRLNVNVVPGSGTGDLSGIYGGLKITIEGGKHSYVLDYGFSSK